MEKESFESNNDEKFVEKSFGAPSLPPKQLWTALKVAGELRKPIISSALTGLTNSLISREAVDYLQRQR